MRNLAILLSTSVLLLGWNSSANAQLGNPVCSSQRVTPMPPQAAYYQIKGTCSATVSLGTTTVVFKFKFQKKVAGVWQTSFESEIMTNAVGTGASADTGWITFTPAQTVEWRVLVDGSYVTPGPPTTSTPFAGIGSLPITPSP